MASRFHQTNSNELEALKSKTRNKNTDSTGTWINTFQSRAKERGLNQEFSSYVPQDLNDVLMKFYAELRKADGSEYEPACLRVMTASLYRYLKEKKYPVQLLDMDEFKESNLILEGKEKDLTDRDMGNRPNRALPITKREDEIL